MNGEGMPKGTAYDLLDHLSWAAIIMAAHGTDRGSTQVHEHSPGFVLQP